MEKKKKRESAEERLKRVYRQRMMIGAAGLILCLYLLGVFWHVFHFQRNTVINGVSVGGKSTAGAAAAFQKAADSYSLSVIDLDGNVSTLEDPELNMTVEETDGIRSVLKAQSAWNWLIGGFIKKSVDVDVKSSYNEEVMDSFLVSLDALNAENMTAPTDASLQEQDDGSVVITPETEGTELDIASAKAGIRAAAGGYRREVHLSDYQIHPSVYRDDEGLNRRLEAWNGYLESAGLSFAMPGGNVTLDQKTIASLLHDDGAEVTVSYSMVADLMAEWKDTYNTYAHKFTFHTTNGDDVTIMPWGDYGYQLDEEGTAQSLISCLKGRDHGTHEASWFQKGNSLDNMGLGGDYVEVSIEDQHIWIYRDGEMVLDTDVVTGNPNPDEKGKNRETYLGCYSVKNKMEDVTLGTLDVQGYESPVDYWIPFNGGEGFHDAPWRDSFGGSIYLTNGSHGCVNCPPEVMGTIYKTIEVGDPVVIY